MRHSFFAAIAAVGLLASTAASAQIAISGLPSASALTGTEFVPVVQSAATRKATVNQISAKMLAANNTWTGAQTFTTAFAVTAPNFVASGAGLFFGSMGSLQISTDGVFRMWNNAGTDFGRLQFGGVTSSFPAIKRSGATLQVRLADDSNDADLSVQALIANNVVKTVPFTVTTLPSAATKGAGARSFVTDATATTFNSVVAGGGANGVPVFSDGTNWRIGD